jgi:hypothetical protein
MVHLDGFTVGDPDAKRRGSRIRPPLFSPSGTTLQLVASGYGAEESCPLLFHEYAIRAFRQVLSHVGNGAIIEEWRPRCSAPTWGISRPQFRSSHSGSCGRSAPHSFRGFVISTASNRGTQTEQAAPCRKRPTGGSVPFSSGHSFAAVPIAAQGGNEWLPSGRWTGTVSRCSPSPDYSAISGDESQVESSRCPTLPKRREEVIGPIGHGKPAVVI